MQAHGGDDGDADAGLVPDLLAQEGVVAGEEVARRRDELGELREPSGVTTLYSVLDNRSSQHNIQ